MKPFDTLYRILAGAPVDRNELRIVAWRALVSDELVAMARLAVE
jgi:hypothetical protein